MKILGWTLLIANLLVIPLNILSGGWNLILVPLNIYWVYINYRCILSLNE